MKDVKFNNKKADIYYLSAFFDYILSNLNICPLTIISTKSTIQIMFQPSSILNKPATILPSIILVTAPQIKAVIGIIARIMLTSLDNPK